MRPLVSILTPSYNQAQWLGDNLRSVAEQDYPQIEHIVMDGGSTDNTRQILEHAGSSVQWRSEPDRGQSHALNKAFEESKGEIIGWLNSDDAYVDRRAVAAAVGLFNQHPEVGVVYGHGLLVNQVGRVLQFIWTPPYVRAAMERGTFFVQPSVFIRRSVLQSPFVDESLQYVMDYDLWRRLLDKTGFMRLDLVVGMDRHQPARKVLQTAYPLEHRAYELSHGRNPDSLRSQVFSKVQKVSFRMRGVMDAVTLPSRVDPAVDIEFGTLLDRLRFQALTRRSKMPFD